MRVQRSVYNYTVAVYVAVYVPWRVRSNITYIEVHKAVENPRLVGSEQVALGLR